jgi:hypothetical protein
MTGTLGHSRADDATRPDDEADDRTVRQRVQAPSSGVKATSPAKGPTRPAAGGVIGGALVSDDPHDDPLEDSVATLAPRVPYVAVDPALSARGIPIALPGSVEIRTLEQDDEEDPATEVRARPPDVPREAAPRPAAGAPPPASALPRPNADLDEDAELERGGTTERLAPSFGPPPKLGGGVPAAGTPPTRAAPLDAYAYANDEDDDDDDENTKRQLGTYVDDSVTTQAPAVPLELIEAALNGADADTSATLKKVSSVASPEPRKGRAHAPSAPNDGDAESVTSRAPPELTNILRVIASGSMPDIPRSPAYEEDEAPETRTEVMDSAPLQRIIAEVSGPSQVPPMRPGAPPYATGPRAAVAPQLERSSESGMRLASAGGERASLGALGIGPADPRGSGSIRIAGGGSIDPRAYGGDGRLSQPSEQVDELGRSPRYGLLVAVVGLVSLIVPITLFVVLRRDPETIAPAVAAEPASEIETHDPARAKGVRRNGVLVPVATSSAPTPGSAGSSPRPGSRGLRR